MRVRRRDSTQCAGEVSDEALLGALAEGDEQAGVVFVRRYQRRLFGLAMTLVGDPSMAEDVAQEAFLRIFRHASIYDERRGSVGTWALTITRNLAIDFLRVRRATPVPPDDRVLCDLVSDYRHPEEVALVNDDAQRARTALATLPLEQRRSVVLATMFGRTAAEIAEIESIPLGTAKSRLRLGMARLRATMTRLEVQ